VRDGTITVVGSFGEVHRRYARGSASPARPSRFDLDLDNCPLAKPAQMRAITRHPASARDVLAAASRRVIPAARVEEVIEKSPSRS